MPFVLLIDDDKDFRDMLRITLEKEGYIVHVAQNGNEGLDAARDHQFDLVITDIVMPEKEGFETIRELRSEFPDLAIIAISGGGRILDQSYLGIAEALGARRAFPKPLDISLFLRAVSELTNRPSQP